MYTANKNLKTQLIQNKNTSFRSAIAFFLALALVIMPFGCKQNVPVVSPSQTSNPITTIILPPSPTIPPPTTIAKTLDNLTVHFIDVGQGDAILIDYGTNEILIDGGGRSPGVIQYLNQYVDGDLEVMIATHPHADHIGGLIAVFEVFKVNEVWHNGVSATSATYTEFTAKMVAEGSVTHVARRGDTITTGALNLQVLNPTVSLTNDTNEDSIVLRMVWGNQAFLFTGDAGLAAEESMIAAGLTLQANILKVGHHGSYSATSQTFLNVVKPNIAVYMAKIGNSYGHPHQVTIDSLRTIGVLVFGTDVNGSVIITVDGVSLFVQITKGG